MRLLHSIALRGPIRAMLPAFGKSLAQDETLFRSLREKSHHLLGIAKELAEA